MPKSIARNQVLSKDIFNQLRLLPNIIAVYNTAKFDFCIALRKFHCLSLMKYNFSYLHLRILLLLDVLKEKFCQLVK